MFKQYCQGHSTTKQDKRLEDRATREKWIEANPPDEYGYWDCYLQISPMCPKCLTIQTMSIEHMIPKNRGSEYRHDLSNLRPSCIPCNGLKGSRTVKSLAGDYPHLRVYLED